MSGVVTRFAPSPTGFLHIGGARTALFNWLYAKRYGGKFLLRIEDTDRKRSTQEAISAIIDGLKWLGIRYDGEVIYQSRRTARYIEVANLLVKRGSAYYCYCIEDKIVEKKVRRMEKGKIYRHKCTYPTSNTEPVIRFNMPDSEDVIFNDKIYGQLKISSAQLDNIVILRSDKTPTYILAVVVDDHDDGITDVIRGSDHLTNTFKQVLIYKALDFNLPYFAHVPLIYGEDGHKLSKRHGAVSVFDYKKMGILPEAMRNYLLRLSWSHSNDEIISDNQAKEWFTLEGIGRSPARFDLKKLEYLNNFYIKNMSNENILDLILEGNALTDQKRNYLLHGLTELKKKANYLTEIPDLARFYIQDLPLHLSDEAKKIVKSNLYIIRSLVSFLSNVESKDWNKDFLSSYIIKFSKSYNIEVRNVYHSLRAPITGIMDSTGIVDVMIVLGKDECIKRLKAI